MSTIVRCASSCARHPEVMAPVGAADPCSCPPPGGGGPGSVPACRPAPCASHPEVLDVGAVPAARSAPPLPPGGGRFGAARATRPGPRSLRPEAVGAGVRSGTRCSVRFGSGPTPGSGVSGGPEGCSRGLRARCRPARCGLAGSTMRLAFTGGQGVFPDPQGCPRRFFRRPQRRPLRAHRRAQEAHRRTGRRAASGGSGRLALPPRRSSP